MLPDPTMLYAVAGRHQELLTIVPHERRAATAADPAQHWRPLAVRAFALLALALGLRA